MEAKYHEALKNWSLGNQVICVEHIFLGIEALKTVALLEHLQKTGKEKAELAKKWEFNQEDKQTLDEFLQAEARLLLIFMGDKKCSKLTKMVSDGFEPGYEEYGRLKKLAPQVIQSSAKCLREGILNHSGLSEEASSLLTSSFMSGSAQTCKIFMGPPY